MALYCREHAEDDMAHAPEKSRALFACGVGGTDTSRVRSRVDAKHPTMCPDQEEYDAETSLLMAPNAGRKRFLLASQGSLGGEQDKRQSIKRVRTAGEVLAISPNMATASVQEHTRPGTGWCDLKVESRF